MIPDLHQRTQTGTQAKLFQNSTKKGINSREFIKNFMTSEIAARWDLPYDRYQWAGEGYIMEEILDAFPDMPHNDSWNEDVMHWIGYLYRYWHFYKNMTSKEIYSFADADKMFLVYEAYHTLNCDMAIDRLMEEAQDTQTNDCDKYRHVSLL